MKEDETLLVGRKLPVIGSVRALAPYRVEVTWASGERRGGVDVVDLAPLVLRFKSFAPLRADPEVFGTAELGPYGSSIEWGGGEIDASSLAIEEIATEAEAAVDFKAFLAAQGWTFDLAAKRLGVSRRSIAYFAAGRPLPKPVALACRYFELARERREAAPAGRRARSSETHWTAA